MSPERLRIVVHCTHQLAMLDVQVFELETLLNLSELVGSLFLERDSFIVEQSDHCIEISFVTHSVEAMAAFFVNIQFLA